MASILWGASAQPGSLFPAIPIVLELQRRGHTITALSDPPAATTFLALGCDFWPASRAAAVTRPAAPIGRAAKADWWARYSLALHQDTNDAMQSARFDAVLADPLETGVGFAAEAAGIPYCSYVHWGLNERGPDVPFCFHLWDQHEPVDAAFSTWWNRLRTSAGLPVEARPASEHRWYRTSPLLTLLLGLPELVHPHGRLPSSAVRVGPTLHDPPNLQPAPDWIATLGLRRPAVLAAVSTIATPHDAQVLQAVAQAAHALDFELVITLPIDCELPPLPADVRVASFLPHGLLLDRVKAFVNHAGNGSVNRAACAGVPVLMLPTGRDQHQVAAGASNAGLGITLGPEDRDTVHVRDALHQLVDNSKFAQTASQLAARARQYDAAATAAGHVEHLLRSGAGRRPPATPAATAPGVGPSDIP